MDAPQEASEMECWETEPPSLETTVAQYLEIFGLAGLRPGQLEAIRSIVSGADCVIVRPTGSGKSLIFQIAALVRRRVTIVISPLIALMADQVGKLKQLGLPVVVVNSRLSTTERRAALEQLANGGGHEPLLAYMAPETMKSEDVVPLLAGLQAEKRISTIVIDEAHLVCSWGHGFREQYRLKRLRETFSGVPVACFTATLPALQRHDLQTQLQLRAPAYHAVSLNRPNIYYVATEILGGKFDGLRSAYAILTEALTFFLPRTQPRPAPPWMGPLTDKHRGGGIVYCHARKTCEAVAEKLIQSGWTRTAFYHADMKQAERTAVFDRWMAGDIDIIVATSALGMGVDKRNVRFVIGFDMTSGVIEYAQEGGRNGRDGLPSVHITFYSGACFGSWRWTHTVNSRVSPDDNPALRSLVRIYGILKGDKCLRAEMLRALDDPTAGSQTGLCCSVCTRAEREEVAKASLKRPRESSETNMQRARNLFRQFHHNAPSH